MNHNNNEHCPWVEKHRPTQFDDIVLDPYNKKILKNIIETSYFPNLLLYGPPGTGKTTTIINLVNAYQEKINNKNKGLMIHLNASDERGIDIIRNQISCFVNSKPLFENGMKFVILDEVDYMTKNAQQALRYLLQNTSNQVRFCLICNYISRIDEGLQNEFLKLRFNQLPEKEILGFLQTVSISEKMNISAEKLGNIQKLFKSDIRSMLNFMQSNQNVLESETELNIIDNTVWEDLFRSIRSCEKIACVAEKIGEISKKYNIDRKNILKYFLNYIIRNKTECVNETFMNFVENIMHFQDCKNIHYINYFLFKISNNISEPPSPSPSPVKGSVSKE
jgi:replication factor C subunit 3/5